jgi:hypothetical protein
MPPEKMREIIGTSNYATTILFENNSHYPFNDNHSIQHYTLSVIDSSLKLTINKKHTANRKIKCSV